MQHKIQEMITAVTIEVKYNIEGNIGNIPSFEKAHRMGDVKE